MSWTWNDCACLSKTVLAILPIAITSIRTTIAFDRLIRIEYERYPLEWEKDGEPAGFGYDPIQTTFKRSSPTEKVFRQWLRTTPEWTYHDPDAMRALHLLRSRYKVSVACFLLFYFCIWIFFFR